MNILNDSDWLVHSKDETPDEITVSATYQPQPIACPHCGVVAKPFKHGVQEQRYSDAPAFGKRVTILAFRQRYRCRDCKRTFLQPLPVDESRKMTRRCLEYIEVRTLRERFTKIAEEVGVTEGTIRNIFHDYKDRLKDTVKVLTPEWLGLDELWLLKKPRAVVANVKARTLIDILVDRDKTTIQRYLQLMPDRSKIEVVTMDMWRPYRDAVHSVLPKAVVVVDKFHVVKLANYAVDQTRKTLREGMTDAARRRLMRDRRLLFKHDKDLTAQQRLTLETWLGNMPALKRAYDAKESFYSLWDASSSREFLDRYAQWKSDLPADTRPVFKELLSAVTNWPDEISAFFTHRATNAYTEALNGLIKIVNRAGRGYSFDVIRAKMLYSTRKDRSVEDTTPNMVQEDHESIVATPKPAEPIITLGVDFAALFPEFTSHESTWEEIEMAELQKAESTEFYE